jgi:adenine-specific DNA-methyltransferase
MAKKPLTVDTLTHDEATRRNAPTAELEAFVPADVKAPILASYERRNPDLDPQLVWRGKDVADWSDLVVEAPPLYIQEKIHAKALIEDLKRASTRRAEPEDAPDLFADFNGITPDQRTEFYAHDQHWSNRMILGDGLKVMASLAEREGLKGQVQCIYIDPPYGIEFNSNFQWSTTSRDVKDGKADHLTREPEQVKAFRDTWADGIHSYLTYLRDRLTVARDLLVESGSVFVQIGPDNVHRLRALMDEVFGSENLMSMISYRTSSPLGASGLPTVCDFILWYAKSADRVKYRQLLNFKGAGDGSEYTWAMRPDGTPRRLTEDELVNPSKVPNADEVFARGALYSSGFTPTCVYPFDFQGEQFDTSKKSWRTNRGGMETLIKGNRLIKIGKLPYYVQRHSDFPVQPYNNLWTDTRAALGKQYVVETSANVIQRCILMTTDPGDLVLDPTCGSGTTAYVAEQWGRRWITIDTSRVALALARARIMGARYPWYLLADSREGQVKEGEVTRTVPADTPTHGRIRQGFVYKRVPHITLKSIANNAEIDTIWEKWQPEIGLALRTMNDALLGTQISYDIPSGGRAGKTISFDMDVDDDGRSAYGDDDMLPELMDWEVPRDWPDDWPLDGREWHSKFWQARIARQLEIDASIAAKADTEYLYDQPYEDKSRVRVAGPFTVESLSPHRVPAMDTDDSLFDELEAAEGRRQPGVTSEAADFTQMVLDNLKRSGVQQRDRVDRLVFSSLELFPGRYICGQGAVRQASEGESDTLSDSPTRRAAIFVGPEYGTVARADLVAASREAAEAGFELLIAASFNFDAHASEFDRMGALTVLQARINPDLHMPDLANTGAGNLFTVFGEPDIQVHQEDDGCISIEVAGVDMYKGGEIVSGDADDIAVWFIDTDYNYESFFVRHAYFPGANDPYKALKTTLKAEIDADAWESLKRTRSRPFPRPEGGKVAVKVINHLGDEVMKVVGV